MRIPSILPIIVLWTAAAVAIAAQPDASSGTIYTADEHGASISTIELGPGRVTRTPIPISPHNSQVSADGKRLLAVGPVTGAGHSGGHAEAPAGKLVILSTSAIAGPREEIDVGAHPAHVVIDKAGARAYVTDSRANVVKVVGIPEKKVLRDIATGALPHGLRMSPDEREIATANVKDGTVSILDVAQARETTRLPVGKAPVQVAFTPDGSRLYVSLRDEDSVAVIDMKSRRKVASIKVGYKPIQLYVTPDGKQVYVANQGTEKKPANTVSVIDTAGNSLVSTITVGRGAHGVVVSDDGAFAFISNIYDDSVSVIDTASRKVVKNFKVGKGPNGITYRRAGAGA